MKTTLILLGLLALVFAEDLTDVKVDENLKKVEETTAEDNQENTDKNKRYSTWCPLNPCTPWCRPIYRPGGCYGSPYPTPYGGYSQSFGQQSFGNSFNGLGQLGLPYSQGQSMAALSQLSPPISGYSQNIAYPQGQGLAYPPPQNMIDFSQGLGGSNAFQGQGFDNTPFLQGQGQAIPFQQGQASFESFPMQQQGQASFASLPLQQGQASFGYNPFQQLQQGSILPLLLRGQPMDLNNLQQRQAQQNTNQQKQIDIQPPVQSTN